MNGDGIYSPINDHPDVVGDLVHWYVMNDVDSLAHNRLFKTDPLGVEVRVMIFGFDISGALGNTMFVQYQIINVGGNNLDSMYIALWSDPDIGDATDDLVGCDPERNLGFCYNDSWDGWIHTHGYHNYGSRPPAVGYSFLQTPIISSTNDTAYVSGKAIVDYVNVSVSAFSKFISADPGYNDPNERSEVYCYMNGLMGTSGERYIDPTTGEVTTFVNNGDPITGEGWLDGDRMPPGDRRFLLSAGPFSMAPGDTQEVVMAIIVSQGANNLLSLAKLRGDLQWVKTSWESQFSRLDSPISIDEIYVPDSTDEIGPFDMVFSFVQNKGWRDILLESAFLHYGIGEIQDSTDLIETIYNGKSAYMGTIPSFPEVSGTTELKYYISANFDDGTNLLWPSGSPTNYNSMLFGPDTTAPVLSHFSINEDWDVHYLLPFKRQVKARVTDDRNGMNVTINWKKSDGEVKSASLQPFISKYWEYQNYRGTIIDYVGNKGDSIYLWITAIDSSSNHNTTYSDTQAFSSANFEVLADWETLRYDGWDLWGRIEKSSTYREWNHFLAFASYSPDTYLFTYDRALDLSYFDEGVWLKIPMAYRFLYGVNAGYFEVSTDSLEWTVVDLFTDIKGPYSHDLNLTPYVNEDPIFIRFRIVQDSSLITEWLMDDIILHSDSTLLFVQSFSHIPDEYKLYNNYPNPFNPSTTIKFSIPRSGTVALTVYDVLGRQVETILNKHMQAGHHILQWNASDVSSGIYFVRMRSGDFRQVRKVMVVR